MQIVINIPDAVYNLCVRNEYLFYNDTETIKRAIKNGILLPKGHGRLIDADALKETFIDSNTYLKGNEKGFWCFTGKEIKDALTIVKADKEGA